MFKEKLASVLATIQAANLKSVTEQTMPKRAYYGDPADKATERNKVRVSVNQYASEKHAAKAMKRYQRWVKNNLDRSLLDMPAHIHEKKMLLASVMS